VLWNVRGSGSGPKDERKKERILMSTDNQNRSKNLKIQQIKIAK
jgi:hypothetical protein